MLYNDSIPEKEEFKLKAQTNHDIHVWPQIIETNPNPENKYIISLLFDLITIEIITILLVLQKNMLHIMQHSKLYSSF